MRNLNKLLQEDIFSDIGAGSLDDINSTIASAIGIMGKYSNLQSTPDTVDIKTMQKDAQDANDYENMINTAKKNIEKEKHVITGPISANSLEFKEKLRRLIATQITNEKAKYRSYTVMNKQHEGEHGVLVKGVGIKNSEKYHKPSVALFIDQSASFGTDDRAEGEKIANMLYDFEQKGLVDIVTWYFGDEVSKDPRATGDGGTDAWPKILKKIEDERYSNVIILSDKDLDAYGECNSFNPAGNYAKYENPRTKSHQLMVPGFVWYLWRSGSKSPNAKNYLMGRRGTEEFTY